MHVHIEFDTTMTGVDKNYKSIGSFRPIKHRIFAILFFTTRLDTVQIRQYSPKFVFERSTSVVIFYCRSLRGLTIIIIIIIIYFNRIIFTVVFANEKWLNDAACRFFFFLIVLNLSLSKQTTIERVRIHKSTQHKRNRNRKRVWLPIRIFSEFFFLFFLCSNIIYFLYSLCMFLHPESISVYERRRGIHSATRIRYYTVFFFYFI